MGDFTKILHHILMVIMIIIIFYAIAYAYYSLQAQELENIEMPVSEETKGAVHPLPDFIIDKIKPDELMDLKQ